MRFGSLLIGLCLVGTMPAIASCSSSDSGAAAAAAQPVVISQKVTAKDGGTVSGPGVSLAIPPGALAADTTITITITAASGAPGAASIAAASVFDFGPDGTTFTTGVPLTLDFDAASAPSGATPAIAFLKNGAWQKLDAGTVAGGKITASTTHFTPFTVVWSGGQQQAGGCSALEFTPCGGDLTGTWSFTAGCVDLSPTQADPTGGKCPSATASATVDFTGTVTFGSDGRYSVDTTQSASITFEVPKSCLPSGASCTSVDASATDKGSTCELVQSQPSKTSTEAGTYTTTSTQFTTVQDGDAGAGTGGKPILYCVNGNKLSAKQIDDSGNTVIYTADKQ